MSNSPHSHTPQRSGSVTPNGLPESLRIADLQSRIEALLAPFCHGGGTQPHPHYGDFEHETSRKKFGQADDEIRLLLADIKDRYIPLGLVSGETLQKACTLVSKAEELAAAAAAESVPDEDVSEVIWQAEQVGEGQEPIEMVDSDAVRAELFALCRMIARFDTPGREAMCKGKRLLSLGELPLVRCCCCCD